MINIMEKDAIFGRLESIMKENIKRIIGMGLAYISMKMEANMMGVGLMGK